ncbi:MAG: protein kinase [Anaerolineales bacterium]|jgi:serine/threonine-protein kinase
MPFASGDNVGPYRIIEKLGRGGMATVFKAYHAALDRFVAIKVLHPAFTQDPSFLKRFQREARLVAKLEHPNIVPVYDYAEHAGQPYLVMKFVEGETLKARLAQGPLSREERVSIAMAVGEALAFAHKQGILHRDVKPSNILLDPEGPIRLADFGLARIASAGSSTISTEMALGTPQYVSPEQARGESDLDEGTDIYSFGILLYEMVVGRVPFHSDTPISIIHDHIYSPLPMPRRLNSNVPQAVERILIKALEKDRADRFGSIEEMLKAFCAAQEAEGEEAPSESMVSLGEPAPPAFEEPPVPSPPWTDPSAEPRASEAAPAAESADPDEVSPKEDSGVSCVAIGLSVCGLVLIALGVFAYRGWRIKSKSENGSEATAVASATVLSMVDRAQATVQANPDDPRAHLLLAQALLREDYPRLAALELINGVELYLEQGAYYVAARAMVNILHGMDGPENADPAVQDLLTQALWLGAGEPRVDAMIVSLQSTNPEWDRLIPLAARVSLLSGDTETAHRRLDAFLAENPEDPYALVALAEVYLVEGNQPLAREIETSLAENADVPQWLMQELRRFSGSLVDS